MIITKLTEILEERGYEKDEIQKAIRLAFEVDLIGFGEKINDLEPRTPPEEIHRPVCRPALEIFDILKEGEEEKRRQSLQDHDVSADSKSSDKKHLQ